MKYNINKENFRNFETFEVNRLSPRAYFIPYSNKDTLLKESIVNERYDSNLVTILNGEWDFVYFDNEEDCKDVFDTDKVNFDKVEVPSTWQRTGYRNPCYLNQRYEFNPKLYPNMPNCVPLGIYRKTIEITDLNKEYILTFLGVMSSIDLYVNGKFVGYGEGSHNSQEFDITSYIKNGINEILVVVTKWSTGTYLECQDMFRENGIFRDVLLYQYEKTYIYDYSIIPIKIDNSYTLDIDIFINGNTSNSTIKIELYNEDKVINEITNPALNHTKLTLKPQNIVEWNAEQPKLYTLIITLINEHNSTFIKQYIGFKDIRIDGNIFLFNDKKIKLKGVNHHDTDMDNGYVRTLADTLCELKLMKKFNINCIRTSHYPPDPVLLTLCDYLGFYIVDEADIETHGTYQCKLGATEHLISQDLRWENRYLDRVSRMFYRDRNHPSITMWSLGNEAGGYKCQDSCYNYLKKVTKIPIHYEGVIRSKRFAYDVISEMYPTHTHVEKIGKLEEKKYLDKPYFMCEYAHAMGVGPGAVREYWDSIYKYDNLLGGCIWEWSDHAVHHKDDGSKYEYTYGGDHKEEKHDKNFCVDGMLFPNKTPHTGCFVIGNVYRPVISKHIKNNEFSFTNTNRFKNANYLTVKCYLVSNGIKTQLDNLTLNIEPQQTITLSIPFTIDSEDIFINFEYYDNEIKIANEQHILKNELKFNIEKSNKKPHFTSICGEITIKIDNGEVKFTKDQGLISYNKNGFEYINQDAKQVKGFTPNICRADLDNDAFGFKKPWEKIDLKDAKTICTKFEVKENDDSIKILYEYKIKRTFTFFTINVSYKVYENGLVKIKSELQKELFGSNEIQRFGEFVELNTSLSNVEFYGRANDEKFENLSDLLDHTSLGIYNSTVDKMHENYVMPQDNTNITDCKKLVLSDKQGHSILFVSKHPFSFSVHDYTQLNLDKAKHIEDLIHNTLMLSIDGYMRGTGTNTCGEDTLNKYKIFTTKPLIFSFSFIGK